MVSQAHSVICHTCLSKGILDLQTKKRSYSVVRDTPEDLRRVRTKIDGNPINITKFKQVDFVRNRPGTDYNKVSAIL
jgi:hypothetical protein